MVTLAVLVAAFVVLVFGTQAWTMRRTWRGVARAFEHVSPCDGPSRDDARALAHELTRLGFVSDGWRWLEGIEWACLVLQRDDGTRALILSGNKPPGFDITSQIAGGLTLVTQESAYVSTPATNVRQALGPMPLAAMIAAHDRVLDAIGHPPLVVHAAGEVTDAALRWEHDALEGSLRRGWGEALAVVVRAMLKRQMDTTPILERPADLERLRSAAPR